MKAAPCSTVNVRHTFKWISLPSAAAEFGVTLFCSELVSWSERSKPYNGPTEGQSRAPLSPVAPDSRTVSCFLSKALHRTLRKLMSSSHKTGGGLAI